MKRDTKTVVEELLSAQEDAAIDVDSKPRAARPAFEIRKRQAETKIQALTDEYQGVLFQDAVGIFIIGSPKKSAEFAAVAEKVAKTLTCDVDEVYKFLAAQIEPLLGASREFQGLHLTVLIQSIKAVAIASAMRAKSLTAPVLKDSRVVPTTEALVAFIKSMIQEAMGNDLMVAYLGKSVSNRALKLSYAESPAKIVVVNATAPEAQLLASSFRSRRQFKLNDTAAIDESFAIGVVEGKKAAAKPPADPPKQPEPANVPPPATPAAS